MSKVSSLFDEAGTSAYYDRQLRRIHRDILAAADQRDLSKCGGNNCSLFEFFGDERTTWETIVAVADEMNKLDDVDIEVPEDVRQYVDSCRKRYGSQAYKSRCRETKPLPVVSCDNFGMYDDPSPDGWDLYK